MKKAALVLIGVIAIASAAITYVQLEQRQRYKEAQARMCQNLQAQGKANLQGIYIAEIAFHGEHDRYASLDEVGFRPSGRDYRYTLELTKRGFTARAVGDIGGPSVMTIDENNKFLIVKDRCADL